MTTRLWQGLVALGGAALCCLMVLLGLWQMSVFESQKSDSTAARASAAPVPLESNLVGGKVGDLYGRRVTVTGTYLPGDSELVGTAYPLRVVTAFHTAGGRTLAVVRGTVAAGTAVPSPPAGTRTLTGIMLPSEADATSGSATGLPAGTRSSLQLEQLVQAWPVPLLDGYLTVPAGESAAEGLQPAEAKVPDTSGGHVRNQGYALQWWAFAVFGAVVTVLGVRAIGRRDSEPVGARR